MVISDEAVERALAAYEDAVRTGSNMDAAMAAAITASEPSLIGEVERLRAALAEYDRLSLVIYSAVANSDPPNKELVAAAIQAGRRALTEDTTNAT